MNIVIMGCGKIGSTILSSLCNEGHDVTVIERSADTLKEITNIYDVMGICGNGADSDILEEASVKDAELFIAITGSDELNMLSCFMARKMGAKHTIARIRNPEYNDASLGFLCKNLELSMAINPEMLAAQELFNILKFPSAINVEKFSRGNLEMIELKLKPDSVLDGIKLMDIRKTHNAKVLICYVMRDDEVFIPDGNFVLRSGDKIGLAASVEEVGKFFRSLGVFRKQAKNIMLLGASRISYYLAKMLISSGASVKIIEKDHGVCDSFCEALPKAIMINSDGAKREILIEEGINNLDAFVSLTGTDEENILISIFAASQNVPKVISKIDRDELIGMAENLGLESIISPKKIISDVLLSYARALANSMGSNIETLYQIADGKAEALEFNVRNDSPVIGVALRDLDIKNGILIAGIIRGTATIIPAGNDVIRPGDSVVVIAANQRLQDISDILK